MSIICDFPRKENESISSRRSYLQIQQVSVTQFFCLTTLLDNQEDFEKNVWPGPNPQSTLILVVPTEETGDDMVLLVQNLPPPCIYECRFAGGSWMTLIRSYIFKIVFMEHILPSTSTCRIRLHETASVYPKLSSRKWDIYILSSQSSMNGTLPLLKPIFLQQPRDLLLTVPDVEVTLSLSDQLEEI